MSLKRPFNYLARKLLYSWIRTEILPTNLDQIHIDPEIPVIYVLDSRAWSSLLVLEEECARKDLVSPLSRISFPDLRAWHSVYTVAPRQPFKAWLQKQPKRSRMLRGILEILLENPDRDVQFIPVTIFWGRPVAKQKHWFTVLFAQSWGFAGRIRKFFTIIFHGHNTLVQFSEAISYRTYINAHLSNDENIDNIQRKLADRLIEIKTATLGPDISHRRTLVRDLVLSPSVQNAIQKRSNEDNISIYKASLQARRYLYEIVADWSSITIRILQSGLTAFWNKFYSGIEVNHSEILRKLALNHELVYVPCHRSHIDYLLLSYVIHYEGLAIPQIAAGKNLNMPVIGSILRGGGAFFIRRSFKGNELYSTVLFEYISKLLSLGTPIEYFVEGGRSRTGRLLKPKPGMLSMTIRGYLKYRKRPVVFIPVYIGYEKMIEGRSYLAELSGYHKKTETLFTSVTSILRIKGNFGKAYANFGAPVFLSDILDDQYSQWHILDYDDTNRPEWLKSVVNETSQQIMTRINQAASVNSVNLLSTILLATSRQHMDESELVRVLDIITSLIRSLDYSNHVTITALTGEEQIKRAELLGMVKRREHQLGDIIYLDPKNSVLLTYYRNNILHLMALPSVIACCFLNTNSLSHAKITNLVSLAYPFLKAELFLPWQQEHLPSVVDNVLDIMVLHNLLIKNEKTDSYKKPGASSLEYSQLELLARVISPLLELYYMTFALLFNKGTNTITQEDLIELAHLMAQRVSMIYELDFPDFFDKKLITNFIDTLIKMNYVTVTHDGLLEYQGSSLELGKDTILLLNTDIRSSILQLLKSHFRLKK